MYMSFMGGKGFQFGGYSLRVNENHNDPLTPGALSRWLLWGESRSLARNTAAFRRRFRLQ